MALFGRQLLLDIGKPGVEGKRFRDLSIKASIDMRKGGEPNSGQIQITNANARTIALIQEEGAVVRLFAGYDVPLLLFQGDPVEGGVEVERSGADRVLKIEAQDGGRAYGETRVSVSYAASVSLGTVFDDVMAQLGLGLGSIDIDRTIVFPPGLTLSGPASEVMDRLSVMSGGDWTIRDGAVQVVKPGATTGEGAVLFSSATGNLVGAPKLQDKGNVEVKALLAPSMRPYKAFRVESELVTGNFRAAEVRFDLSTRGREFYVIVKGEPL